MHRETSLANRTKAWGGALGAPHWLAMLVFVKAWLDEWSAEDQSSMIAARAAATAGEYERAEPAAQCSSSSCRRPGRRGSGCTGRSSGSGCRAGSRRRRAGPRARSRPPAREPRRLRAAHAVRRPQPPPRPRLHNPIPPAPSSYPPCSAPTWRTAASSASPTVLWCRLSLRPTSRTPRGSSRVMTKTGISARKSLNLPLASKRRRNERRRWHAS